jgi:hypothetical protein
LFSDYKLWMRRGARLSDQPDLYPPAVPLLFSRRKDQKAPEVAQASGKPSFRTSERVSIAFQRLTMCRNIKTLFNFEPPATEQEIRASALQFVRKLSGYNQPSKANEAAFNQAVEQVSEAARTLIHSLVTMTPPRDRESERARAVAEAAKRFGRPSE